VAEDTPSTEALTHGPLSYNLDFCACGWEWPCPSEARRQDAERVRQEAADTSGLPDKWVCSTCGAQAMEVWRDGVAARVHVVEPRGHEPTTATSGLLHWVRCLVALYDNDMEALPGGDNDPVQAWDDVMREFRKAVADADGSTQEEQEAAHTSGLTDRAVALIVGSTQDERGQPPIREAADTSGLREALEALPSIIFTPEQDSSAGDVVYRADVLAALRGATERPLDVERLTTAMANVGAYYRAEHPNGDYTMVPRTTGNFAALIAVEYARLASPTTTTPETEG
jgi:hypothetical protein